MQEESYGAAAAQRSELLLLGGGWGCGGSIRLWLRGMKSLYALTLSEVLAGLSGMLELSPLLSKTACSASDVVSLHGVLGEVVGGGVVEALDGAGGLAWITFCLHFPYLSQIGLGVGDGRSGGEAVVGGQAGSNGGEVIVEDEEVEEVEVEVVEG